MRGLRAAFYKDFRLFFNGAGLAAALLPLALLAALRTGMGDLSALGYVQPFPVAVRDLDGTIMSRSLTSQMARLEIFSQVVLLEEESDADALEQGAAAVITIPKDFFFDLYTMDDCPVDVTLNTGMELESTLLRAIFSSVMDIIHADQAAWLGVYRFCYGELTEQHYAQLYAQAADSLIQDALGRQTVFASGIRTADLQGAMERRLLASVLSALALFFALAAVKTLPEELRLGVLPRYRAAGGSRILFALSKLLMALLLSLPALALILLFLRPERPEALLFTACLLLTGAFGLLLFIAAWSGSPAAAQRRGNLFLLLSLALGGTLWPRQLLPGPLFSLGGLTLPSFALLGLEAAHRGADIPRLTELLWPLPAMGAGGVLLALPALLRQRGRRGHGRPAAAPAPEPPPPAADRGTLSRLAGMAGVKLGGMTGGAPGLAAILTAAVLCGLVAASAQGGAASSLRLAVYDQDGTALSRELIEALEAQDGLSLSLCDAQEGERALLLGTAEGLLTIGEGYAEAMAAAEQPPLDYAGAASAVSVQGAREIVAGQVAVQASRLRALLQAEELLGRELSDGERGRLTGLIRENWDGAPALYHIKTMDGASPAEPFLPSPMGFAALAALLVLLTAADWSGGDGRQAERRLGALPRGRLLFYGSEWLSLSLLGLLTALAVLLAAGDVTLTAGLSAAAYALCAAALALALVRFTALEGRVDGLAPFLALILCLLGGCFMDLSQLSPGLEIMSLATPTGLAVRAAEGSREALGALLAESALFALLGRPGRR